MFDHLLGNQRAKDTIRRMLEAGRVPGGLLFAGEDGVGKKLFALELAKSLNCRARVGVEACGKCASCQRIMRFALPASDDRDAHKKIIWSEHPDVGMARPYGRAILVDQMRDLEREANFRPFEGAARVFLIEDADKLNDASSNALLKTLEEPPVTSHLILITARPASLLPTIRSRCQALRFAPLSAQEIETHLLSREKKLSQRDARVLARLAQGSIGRALSANLESYLARREAMLEVLNAAALTGDRSRLLRAAEEMNDARRKDEYEPRLDVLEILIRDVWALALGAPPGQLVNDDVRAQLSQLSARVESRRAAGWLTLLETLRGQLSVNINRKVATDALFLAMARPQSSEKLSGKVS
jgi:DNA polymerase-3 subunit delta'